MSGTRILVAALALAGVLGLLFRVPATLAEQALYMASDIETEPQRLAGEGYAMERGRARGVTAVLMTIALAWIVMIMPLAGALTVMGTATAATMVSYPPASCSGGVDYTPQDQDPYRLNSDPDTVRIPYDFSWADDRPDHSSPTATHYFALQTVHDSNTQSKDQPVDTDGQDSGSDSLTIDVPDVGDGDTIAVTYTANLSATGVSGCPVLSSVTMYFDFYY